MAQVGRSDVVRIYNNYLVQLLNALKEIDTGSKVRSLLKAASIRAVDRESAKYITLTNGELLSGENAMILPSVKYSSLVACVTGGEHVARPYVALLDLLSATYQVEDDVLATQVLRAISAVQARAPEAQAQVSAIFDDEVQARLRILISVSNEDPALTSAPGPSIPSAPFSPNSQQEAGQGAPESEAGSAFMDALAGSSIATIAKEIADELVDSDLLKDFGTDPAQIDFASLLDPSSKLGGIAKLVSSKLHDQLGSGKLDQGKLMTEVMSMFGNLNGGGDNPLLSQVMQMAKQMGANTGSGGGPKMPAPSMAGGTRATTARNKLQEKLAKRSAQ